jgi:glucosamine kinase
MTTISTPHNPRPATSPTSPAFHLGIDGGGTATRARLTTPDGRVRGEGQAGPSALGQGIAQAWRHVDEAVAAAFAAAGLPVAARTDIALGLGLSGAENPGWVRDFLAHPAAQGWGRLVLDGDGYTALLGAHAGAPGALITVGTGSVGVARHPDGRRQTVGGWGWRIGDEGSGAWLGQQAVRHAQQALDGRTAAGALARSLWAECGADRATMLDWCAAADQASYAALAPRVLDLAEADPAAATLITAALDAIADLAHALDPAAALPLAVTGGLGQRLLPPLQTRLNRALTPPAGDALDGALRLLRPTT